eukprot:6364401-Pyramimonas_sp.AAC.1
MAGGVRGVLVLLRVEADVVFHHVVDLCGNCQAHSGALDAVLSVVTNVHGRGAEPGHDVCIEAAARESQ